MRDCITGAISDFAFLDKVTAKQREKGIRKHRKKYNEQQALDLARQMALENGEMFEDFCESQYPTQGRVLYNALKRAKPPRNEEPQR